MVISSNSPDPPPTTSCVSRSCPDITYQSRHQASCFTHGSLPDHLEAATVFGVGHVGHHAEG